MVNNTVEIYEDDQKFMSYDFESAIDTIRKSLMEDDGALTFFATGRWRIVQAPDKARCGVITSHNNYIIADLDGDTYTAISASRRGISLLGNSGGSVVVILNIATYGLEVSVRAKTMTECNKVYSEFFKRMIVLEDTELPCKA